MNDPLLIGIDIGTTAVKGALFDLCGTALKSWGEAYPTARPAPGHVEQNPEDWMDRVLKALAVLSEGVPEGRIAAVGVTSQVNTHAFLDAAGAPLLPAFVWQDGRCAEAAGAIDARIAIEDKLKWWNAPLPVDASHPLARIAYVAAHEPDIFARTRWVCAPKDFCIYRLTGEMVADPMTNFGLLDQNLQPISALINAVPGAEERLPPIQSFTTPAGRIRVGLPCAGALVVTGAMDAWAGLFGVGAIADGQAMYLSGTSEILGIVSPKRVPTPGVIAFADCEGLTLHAGPTQSGGASVQWLSRLLGRMPPELSTLVAARPAGAATPLFLPHLQGERAPIWDIGSRGAFAGLDASMGAADVAASVFEGVAFSARWLLEALRHRPHPGPMPCAMPGAARRQMCGVRSGRMCSGE